MNSAIRDIWVFIETDDRGEALPAGLQLLTPGRILADKCGAVLTAVILGSSTDIAVSSAEDTQCDRIIVNDVPALKEYSTDSYTEVFYHLAEKYRPDVILIGATERGRDFAPRLSCRLDTGLTADCTAVRYNSETGLVEWTRPALGGNIMADIVCKKRRPQMGTVRPGVFRIKTRSSGRPEIIPEDYAPALIKRVKLLEIIGESTGDKADLDNAEIIVSGGRGLGSAEGFGLIGDFAAALGGSVGASRAAVDAGWISHSHQVGQTGSTVSPRLYIACGISGAVQHIAGISGADYIAAINSDADAPIFGFADFGIVGDLYTVIPEIIRELKNGN